MFDSPQVFVVGSIKGCYNFNCESIFIKYYWKLGDNWKHINGLLQGESFQTYSQDFQFIPIEQPIELHASTKTIKGWPKLLLEVWQEDEHKRISIAGYGVVTIPMGKGLYKLEVPCWRPHSGNLEVLIGAYSELQHADVVISNKSRFGFKTETTGNVQLELEIQLKNFQYFGIQFDL